MKILSLVSSHRMNGNTAHIVQLIEERMRKLAGERGVSLEFETLFPGHMDIKLCRGCRVCFDKGEDKCPLRDDIAPIREKMRQADGFIMASPVYSEDVNGTMKNCIDRCAFYNHRPAFAGKPAYAVTTSGIGSSGHAMKTMTASLRCWGYAVSGGSKFRMGALMDLEKVKEKYAEKIDRIARGMLESTGNKKAFIPSFVSMLFFRVQQKYWLKRKGEHDTIDYAYWEGMGWLKKGCSFYVENRAGWLKKRLAGLTGDIIAIFFV